MFIVICCYTASGKDVTDRMKLEKIGHFFKVPETVLKNEFATNLSWFALLANIHLISSY